MDVIQAASYLQMCSVIKLCGRYLHETLTIENVIQRSQVIEQFGLNCLISEQQTTADCFANFIRRHFAEISIQTGFSHVSYDVLRRVLSRSDLTCSELTVYDIVLEWIESNPTQDVVRMRGLIDCVYFLCMSKLVLLELKNSKHAVDDSYLAGKLDKALHYLDPDISLAERLEIGTPERLIRGTPSVIAIGGFPLSSGDPSLNPLLDAVQVLVYSLIDPVQIFGSDADLVKSDACTWRWEQSNGILPPYVKSSVASMDGMMFICGGRKPPNGNEDLGVTRNCYIFDPILWQLKQIASLNIPRIFFPLVACTGYLYAIGGVCDGADDICETIERYSLRDNHWTIHSHLPEPIFADAATCNGNSIYVYGGPDRFSREVDRFFSYDTMTQEWKTLPTPSLRRNFTREDCTLLSIEQSVVMTRPGMRELSVFDTNIEQWTKTEMDSDYPEDPPPRGIVVVNKYPLLHENPILFYLGGYSRDVVDIFGDGDDSVSTCYSCRWATLEYDSDGQIVAYVDSLPPLEHLSVQPLCATVPIPSFRLETIRNELIEQNRKEFAESVARYPRRYDIDA